MITYWKNDNGLIQIPKYEKNCWIDVVRPTLQEVKTLIEQYKLDADFITDVLDIDERSRSEVEGRWLMIIYRIPIHNKDNGLPYFTVPLGIIISSSTIITICMYENEIIPPLTKLHKAKIINFNNRVSFILNIFFQAAIVFLRFLKQINGQTSLIERDLESSTRNKELHQLLKMEKCLTYFITSLKSNDLLITRLSKSRFAKLTEEDDDLLEDLVIESKQALEMAHIYSDIQSGMMDAFASIISNNLNVIMKRLTSVTIILMIPTLIASLYGMNVPNFMEHNKYAYLIIIVVSAVLSFLGIRFFIKRDWF